MRDLGFSVYENEDFNPNMGSYGQIRAHIRKGRSHVALDHFENHGLKNVSGYFNGVGIVFRSVVNQTTLFSMNMGTSKLFSCYNSSSCGFHLHSVKTISFSFPAARRHRDRFEYSGAGSLYARSSSTAPRPPVASAVQSPAPTVAGTRYRSAGWPALQYSFAANAASRPTA